MSRRGNPWFGIGFDTWTLGVEAASVIALRSLKVAQGGKAAEAEIRLMVDEKIAASQELGLQATTGGLGLSAPGAAAKTLAHYRRKVRANRRRLIGRG